MAILAAGDNIYAPVDGTVSVLYKTKHAIGITSEKGVEILIHIGIDTVHLDGKYFETFVQQGDVVERGQKLISFNRKKIEVLGYDSSVLVLITSKNHNKIIKHLNKDITISEPIIDIS